MEGLTSKQWQFVQRVFNGANHTEAYRQTYDCSRMQDRTVQVSADELARHPAVVAKLSSMRREVERQSTLAPLITREFVLNGIMQIATNGDKDSTRLRAFELLGKTVGVDLFREHIVKTTEERSVADIEAELRRKLQSLKQTIDGTATPIEPPAPVLNRKRKPRV